MKFFEKKSVVKIEEEDLKDARLSSIDFVDTDVKKRAFIDVLAARLAMKLLFAQKIQANNIYSLYTIRNVLEELDVADIYYQGIKIDVRLVFNKNEIFVPRKHFEYDLLPDLYVVLCMKENLSSAELVGFFEPKNLDKTNANKDFYFYEYENLIKPDKLKHFLDNFKQENNSNAPEMTQNPEALFLSLVDKEISQKDKLSLYKQLAYSFELREKAIEFENFEIISRAIAKNGTMLDDGTLDYVGGTEEVEETEPEIIEIAEELTEELIETEIEGEIFEDESVEEVDETQTEEEFDDQIIDVDSLPDFEADSTEFDNEKLIDDIYSEFEAEAAQKETHEGSNGAIIAGGAIVAAAGLGLAGEIVKAAASTGVAGAEAQGALIAGSVEAAAAAIDLGSGFFDNLDLPELQNETNVDELPEFEDFAQTEASNDESIDFGDFEADEQEDGIYATEKPAYLDELEESAAENDEAPEFGQIEETDLDSEDFPEFEISEKEEKEEELDEAVEIEEENDLPELAETPAFEEIEESFIDDEEMPEYEISEELKEEEPDEAFEIETNVETAEEIAIEPEEIPAIAAEDVAVETNLVSDRLHDLEALEDEDENTNVNVNEDLDGGTDEEFKVTEFEDVSKLLEIDGLDLEPEEITPAFITETTEFENLKETEKEEDEIEEEIPEITEQATTEAPSDVIEFADIAQTDVDVNADELPSFHELVQKDAEENSLGDFEYLVQNSIDEAVLPDFEHLVVGDASEPTQNETATEVVKEITATQDVEAIEELPETEAVEPTYAKPEEPDFTEAFAINRDLPGLNLQENVPFEKLQELQKIDGFENVKSDLSVEAEEFDPKEEVFSLDDFDFNLLEENAGKVPEPAPENDLLAFGNKEEEEESGETPQEPERKEDYSAKINTDSDDFISQIDDFLGEVELSEEQRLLLANSLLDEDEIDAPTQNVEPKASEPTTAQEESVEFVRDQDEQDLLNVLFEKEKIDNLPDLKEQEPKEKPATPQFMTNLKDKKMVIAASIAGVVLVSFVIGGNVTSNQNNANVPATPVATTAPQTDGQTPMSGDMSQPDNSMNAMNGQIDGQTVQSLPGEDQQAQSSRDMGKAVSDAFSSEPVNASISKIAWEVPEDLAYNDSFRKYLQIAGKNLKLNLQNDLLLATEMAYSNKVIADLKIAKDGSLQSENIIVSSGSKQIDKIVLQSVKETLKYLKMPSSELSSGSVNATLIINF